MQVGQHVVVQHAPRLPVQQGALHQPLALHVEQAQRQFGAGAQIEQPFARGLGHLDLFIGVQAAVVALAQQQGAHKLPVAAQRHHPGHLGRLRQLQRRAQGRRPLDGLQPLARRRRAHARRPGQRLGAEGRQRPRRQQHGVTGVEHILAQRLEGAGGDIDAWRFVLPGALRPVLPGALRLARRLHTRLGRQLLVEVRAGDKRLQAAHKRLLAGEGAPAGQGKERRHQERRQQQVVDRAQPIDEAAPDDDAVAARQDQGVVPVPAQLAPRQGAPGEDLKVHQCLADQDNRQRQQRRHRQVKAGGAGQQIRHADRAVARQALEPGDGPGHQQPHARQQRRRRQHPGAGAAARQAQFGCRRGCARAQRRQRQGGAGQHVERVERQEPGQPHDALHRHRVQRQDVRKGGQRQPQQQRQQQPRRYRPQQRQRQPVAAQRRLAIPIARKPEDDDAPAKGQRGQHQPADLPPEIEAGRRHAAGDLQERRVCGEEDAAKEGCAGDEQDAAGAPFAVEQHRQPQPEEQDAAEQRQRQLQPVEPEVAAHGIHATQSPRADWT